MNGSSEKAVILVVDDDGTSRETLAELLTLQIFGGRRSSVASQRCQSPAGCIINTSGFRF